MEMLHTRRAGSKEPVLARGQENRAKEEFGGSGEQPWTPCASLRNEDGRERLCWIWFSHSSSSVMG